MPAAKWMMRSGQGPVQNAASTINLTPQGIATFNNTQNMANAALLNMFGTTDTTVTQQTDVTAGKTPRALQMQAQKENTRDNADRFFMEQFLKKIMKKMVNLIGKRQSSAITIRLFDEELKELERSYPEIREMYDEKTGKVTIKKSQTGSTLYDYEIISGSTYVNDQKTQQENLTMFVQTDGYNFHFGEAVKRIISQSGIQDWDKILEEMTDKEKVDNTIQQGNEQFKSIVAQMQAGQQNMNQIPTEQGAPPQPGQPNQQMPQMPPTEQPNPMKGIA
jgi:hypothetical protein